MSSHSMDTTQRLSDVAEVEATARDYIEGWYTGSAERMDNSLHAELAKRHPASEESGSLVEVTKARMVELTAKGGGDSPDAQIEIIVDDVATDIASARVVSPGFLDYLHLTKTSEGWKIANVLFHTRA